MTDDAKLFRQVRDIIRSHGGDYEDCALRLVALVRKWGAKVCLRCEGRGILYWRGSGDNILHGYCQECAGTGRAALTQSQETTDGR